MLIPLAIDCIIKNTENYEILIWSGTLTSKKQLATSGELPISSSGHVSRYWYIAECIPNFRASYEHVLTTPLPDPLFGSAPTTTGFPFSSGCSPLLQMQKKNPYQHEALYVCRDCYFHYWWQTSRYSSIKYVIKGCENRYCELFGR